MKIIDFCQKVYHFSHVNKFRHLHDEEVSPQRQVCALRGDSVLIGLWNGPQSSSGRNVGGLHAPTRP